MLKRGGGRCDNPIVVEHVRPINSVSNERTLNSFRERDALNLNKCLSLSDIHGAISIVDELAKSTSQYKLILRMF